ncbi:glycoside hydrolase family 55 protein [Microbacterium terricola]|uniref:Coagulation factor 5/8 type n=1 Tax=Microbacterium terricola TaxID=344163 RepID=A0ABM8DXD0_9MICO|nr:glycoside hydrolase family 55 protein [Microbacterium terricola]UYK38974.1 glycoside hydrolase family 55 protein [Microbacterium terricola]BDV30323.1 coagulation factor 5/8 type [Microbacterium terricola]
MTARSFHARQLAAAGLGVALIAAALTAVPASAAPRHGDSAHPDFGPNVTIYGPDTPLDQIQSELDALADEQRDAEMSAERHAVYFLPGDYGTAEAPLQFEVGYYTEVAGLGASPEDVNVNGAIEVYNRCLGDEANPNCIALVNFWRTISNLSLEVNGAGQDGCRASANFWAVSQAVSMRRLDISGANLSLMDYCTAGPQYASGGFIADSRLPFVISGSQQQWLTRNSEVAGWSNGVWNQVFSGVVGAPSEANFPAEPYTTVAQTPVSREKPYLYVDDAGRYKVRVPAVRTNTSGVSWADGETAGRSIPISDFYIAKPGDSARKINAALALGKNLLFTPGVYDIDRTLQVWRPGTVVLGMGHATLTAKKGATPITVADVPGVVLAGLTVDAGEKLSRVLVKVGHGQGSGHLGKLSKKDPITLSDVYFRVGGPHVGKATTALEINADNVLIDHTWVWRADHGVEGFTNGVNGDTDRWRTNTGRNGVIVNGDNVTATGLFVEHFQRYNLLWKGDKGRVILYQNELPYDPPTQKDWTQRDGTLGYPGYVVGDDVKSHRLDGGGVYVFNQNNPSIITENGFSVPDAPGVKLHHIMTVNLSAGTITHVVNGVGGQADNTNTGSPQFIVDYPAS